MSMNWQLAAKTLSNTAILALGLAVLFFHHVQIMTQDYVVSKEYEYIYIDTTCKIGSILFGAMVFLPLLLTLARGCKKLIKGNRMQYIDITAYTENTSPFCAWTFSPDCIVMKGVIFANCIANHPIPNLMMLAILCSGVYTLFKGTVVEVICIIGGVGAISQIWGDSEIANIAKFNSIYQLFLAILFLIKKISNDIQTLIADTKEYFIQRREYFAFGIDIVCVIWTIYGLTFIFLQQLGVILQSFVIILSFFAFCFLMNKLFCIFYCFCLFCCVLFS